MKKFLLSCLLFVSMGISAQITLGAGSVDIGVAPISTYYEYSYVQQIFTKQEINANAARNITGLKFYLDPSLSISSSSQWVVYLGHTSATSFSSSSDWVPLSQLTQVFSGTVSNVNGEITVTFTTPFPYNNVSNLVIAAEENSAGYDQNNSAEAMNVYNGSANSTLYFRNDNIDPDPASPPSDGVLENYKSVTTFEGLTLNPIPACPMIMYPANNADFVSLTPAVSWANTPGAVSYKVSIGTTPNGTDVVNQVSVTTNTYTPSTVLAANTDYYLKVTAVGAGGESSGCTGITFSTVPPPPSNDNCGDAVTLTVNNDLNCGSVTPGYTLGATDSGTIPDPCFGTADDDVWFKFVATAAAHRISLTNVLSVGSTPNDVDIYFQVFSGSCGTLTSIECSDADSKDISGLTVGETYWVRVYSYYGAGSNQSFDICIGSYPPPPVNDACSGAISATVFPFNYVQNDGAGSTNNGGMTPSCGGSGMNDGMWFTFTGDGTSHNIEVEMPAGSNFDPKIGVYSGSCAALSCVDAVDAAGAGGTETISIPTVSGTTYYVNVGYYGDFTDELEGNFSIDITKGALSTDEVKTRENIINAYPNPFVDILNISDVKNVKAISVLDVAGRVVKTIEVPDSSLRLGELKSGMYIVVLNMNNGSRQTIKVIKK